MGNGTEDLGRWRTRDLNSWSVRSGFSSVLGWKLVAATPDLQESVMRTPALLVTVALFVAAPVMRAQTTAKPAQDPQLGVWEVDLAKSRYYPGPPPISETRTFTREKDGVKGTVVRKLANGQEERIEYRA